MKNKSIQYDNPSTGCYIDESTGSADDCNLRTIQFAQRYGFAGGSLPAGDSEDYSQALSDMADNAVMFLNDLEKRPSMFWEFEDNSLYLSQLQDHDA